ncbi:outer membrane beta-barrel protein [Aquimarina agarilytica]|uniref:outer membrane beta-barrel protein n=1 Tax=Aquimarina agarilytica TaxID=1087449 RepID=UPI00028912EE|nr:outer membrane beta-barrel protein [Aquimarina agarilytica]
MKNQFLVSLFCLTSTLGFAQEQEEKSEKKAKTTFTGSVDAFYSANFNDVEQTLTYPPYENNAFSLGWVSVGVKHEAEKYGFQANLAFGPKNDNFYGTRFYAGEGESAGSAFNYVRDAFAYVNATDKLKISGGVFQAFYGYEFDDVHLNQNYSHGYVYGASTAGVMGAKIDYAFADKWNVMLGVFNNIYQREENSDDNNKALAVNLSYTDDPLWVAATYLNSTEPDGTKYNIFDLVGGFTLSDTFTLGYSFQHLSISEGFLGNDVDANVSIAALYPLITFNDKFSVGLRGEILLDEQSFYTGPFNEDLFYNKNTLYNVTASFNYHVSENLKITPEIRLDGASKASFTKDNGTLTTNDSFGLVALTYLF